MLFDRLKDPEQTKNLYNNPEYAKVINDLAERVIRHNIEVDSPAASWL
jgi:predicted secreted protein